MPEAINPVTIRNHAVLNRPNDYNLTIARMGINGINVCHLVAWKGDDKNQEIGGTVVTFEDDFVACSVAGLSERKHSIRGAIDGAMHLSCDVDMQTVRVGILEIPALQVTVSGVSGFQVCVPRPTYTKAMQHLFADNPERIKKLADIEPGTGKSK